MKYLVALAVTLGLTALAFGQHGHGAQKGPNGGPMEDVAGVHAEFLASGNTITINIFDEAGKPLNAAGYSGSVLVVSGSNRETLALAPVGGNALKGDTKAGLARDAAITLMVKTESGKTGQARFKCC